MKRIVSAIALLALASVAMPLQAQRTLRPSITIKLPKGEGSNAAAIVWNPLTKKYYTTIVGNAIYYMGVYGANGKPVQEDVAADNDYRGFWYNPISKRIEFNCYDDGGIGHLELTPQGMIDQKVIDFSGMNQPSDQCVGVYYPPGNHIIYLNTQTFEVIKYSAKTGETTGTLVTLHVGCKTQAEVDEMDAELESNRWGYRNSNSVQYTGMPKAELAILNHDERIIELYDQKTGLMSKTFFKIPESVTIHSNFNFCYNNGIWWFFDKTARKWVGCK